MSVPYENVDVGEQLANTTTIALKGAGQYVAHVSDASLTADNIALGALGIFIAILFVVILFARRGLKGENPVSGRK